jgi:transposase
MYYGLDVHKDFIQVCCINASNTSRRDFKIPTTREAMEKFADELSDQDQLVLESTFNSWSVYELLKQFSDARIVVAHARDVKAIAHAKVKTDKIDAHILAQLLRMDFIPEVQMPSAQAWEVRQLGSHRRFLIKQRTAAKNSIHSLLHKNFLVCPYPTLFSKKGMNWLAELRLTHHERIMMEHLCELVTLLEGQIEAIEEEFRKKAKQEQNTRLLLTIPGVGITVATGLMAAIDDIDRFKTPQQLASYFGLTPRIHQSGHKSYFGSISKEGTAYGRWLAVEAAQSLALSQGAPIVASYHRIKAKKGHNVAVTALARKLLVLVWHVLTRKTPYRYADPVRTRAKLRELDPTKGPMEAWEAKYKTIDQIYEEFKLPLPGDASAGEKRSARRNKRTVTTTRKKRIQRNDDTKTPEQSRT